MGSGVLQDSKCLLQGSAVMWAMVGEPCNSKGGLTPPAPLVFGGYSGLVFVACSNARCTCEVLYCDICVVCVTERGSF